MSKLLKQNITDYGKKIGKIGTGAYSIVYKTDKNYAIKKTDCFLSTLREITALTNLTHPNIIKIFDVFVCDNDKVKIVLDLFDTNLEKLLKGPREICPGRFSRRPPIVSLETGGPGTCKLEPDMVQSYSYQLLRAIEYCHSNRIIHRDIKPQNIVINTSVGHLKLIDFNSAIILEDDLVQEKIPLTNPVTTIWYRAPEVLMGDRSYSYPIDIWSAGCIIAQMINNGPIISELDELNMLQQIFKLVGTPTPWPGVEQMSMWAKCDFPHYEPIICDQKYATKLIIDMLTVNSSHRISAKDAIEIHFTTEFKSKIGSQFPLAQCDNKIESKTELEPISEPISEPGIELEIEPDIHKIELETMVHMLQILKLNNRISNLSIYLLHKYLDKNDILENSQLTCLVIISLVYEYYECSKFSIHNIPKKIEIDNLDKFLDIKHAILKKLDYNIYPI